MGGGVRLGSTDAARVSHNGRNKEMNLVSRAHTRDLLLRTLHLSLNMSVFMHTDGFNATGRDEPVDRSEVTSHMLSEAFINTQPLENVANCLPPTSS